MLYIKNGLCIDPKTGMHKVRDILTQEDRILRIGEDLEGTEEFRKLP